MARRAGDDKVRYVAFRVEVDQDVPRQAMIQAIQQAGRHLDAEGFDAADVWLTRFDGARGIVRCRHRGAAFTRELLGGLDHISIAKIDVPVRVETVGTSGTIRAVVQRHLPDLEDQGQRRR